MDNYNLRLNVVNKALEYLGNKYVWGSTGPTEFDCSGFTWFIYNNVLGVDINKDGIGIGDTTKQFTSSVGSLKLYKEDDANKIGYIDNIKMGDLVFFHRQSLESDNPSVNNKYPGHVGIYIGSNSFIHASSDSGSVIITNFIDDPYWQSVLVGSKDVFEKK